MLRAIMGTHRPALKALALVLAVALTWSTAAAAPNSAPQQTEAPCEILDNVTWTAAESPYVADCVVRVRDGGFLTVESGTTVRFTDRGGLSVDAGAMRVNGTSPGDVTFTSDQQPPGPGDWRGVEIGDNGSGEIHGLEIRYAGQGAPALTMASITNTVGISNNMITDSVLRDNAAGGIRIEEVDSIIRDVTLRDNRGDGIYVSDTKDSMTNVELTRVAFEDNEGAAVKSEANVQFSLNDNSASGNSLNAISTNGTILFPAVWQGGDLPFVLEGNASTDAKLTIEPNTVVKASRNSGINVSNGELVALGTASEPIYFTTITDDEACTSTKIDCDTESDGPGQQLPGSWSRITFSDKASGGVIGNAEIRYGSDASVRVDRPSVAITSTLVTKSSGDAVEVLENSSSIIDSRFEENAGSGIYIRSGASESVTVTIQGNTFIDNGSDQDDAAVVSSADVTLLTGGNETPGFSNTTNGYLISGDMARPHTWWAGDLPWVVAGTVELEQRAAELTLEPGATVKFRPGARLRVNLGKLTSGTADGERVLITSLKDDACTADGSGTCDTNGDGDGSEPLPGDWEGIEVEFDAVGAFMSNTMLRYGGRASGGLITLGHSASRIEDCEISESEGAGVFIDQVSTSLNSNHIHHCKGDGVRIEARTTAVLVTLSDNLIEWNDGGAVDMDANVELEFGGTNRAENNHRNGITVHGESRVEHRWRASELPYILVDDVSVDDSSKLTIDPGAILKLDFGNSLTTPHGTLIAKGTADDKIIFTSINDDTVGGDSNPRDGDVTPNAGDWRSLKFDFGGGGGELAHAELRYGGAGTQPTVIVEMEGIELDEVLIEQGDGPGIHVDDVPAEIAGVTLRDLRGPGIHVTADNGPINPSIRANTITGCQAAIQVDADVQPELEGNSATQNAINGVLVDGVVSTNRVWDGDDLVWVIADKVSVGTGARLQIAGGTVVKVLPEAELDVGRGSLIIPAGGQSEDRVVLTSIADDSYCDAYDVCDTNSDGGRTEGVPGDWEGIIVGDKTHIVTLRNSAVLYAGGSRAAIRVNGGSITLEDSTIADSLTDGVSINSSRATIVGNTFERNEESGLHLDGESNATIDGNVFVENGRSIEHRATGTVETLNNVAVGNTADAMLYCADVTASQTWHNDLAREIDCDVDIEGGADLTIEPGAVLEMGEGESLRVVDGLYAEGVAFAASNPAAEPGYWDYITFGRQSRGHIRHSLIFFGGTSSTGALDVQTAKGLDVAYNLLLRADMTGISVKQGANPVIRGNIVREVQGRNAATIRVEGESYPAIKQNRLANADIGVHLRRTDANLQINYNNLANLVTFGVKNEDRNVCADSQWNWWGHPSGPYDPDDDSRDRCGAGFENLEGQGAPVSDHVNYRNWLNERPPIAPLVDTPRCGVTNQTRLAVKGTTSPNADVSIYDGDSDTPIRAVVADRTGSFEAEIDLSAGEHRLSADAGLDQSRSARTGFRVVQVEPSLAVDPAGIEFVYGPGDEIRQPLRDESGCATTCGSLTSARVTLPPGEQEPFTEEVKLRVPVRTSPSTVEFIQEGRDPVPLRPATGGYWETSEFAPVQGAFSIRLSGGPDLECLGYIYPGGDGFVYSDEGVEGAPVMSYTFETSDTPPQPDESDWVNQPDWALSDENAYSPPYAWSDSPGGRYRPSQDIALSYSRYINLRNVSAPTLQFWHHYELGRGDHGYVEGRAGADGRWMELAEFEGVSGGWKAVSIPLDDYAKEPRFYLRFRLKTDSREEMDGWHIDNVSVGYGGEMNGRYDKGEPLVEGAKVTLLQRNPDTGEWTDWYGYNTGQVNPQETDEAGRYGFYNLPSGEYKAIVEPPARTSYGPYRSPVLAVWNGTFAHNSPLSGSEPVYLPITLQRWRLK